MLIGEVAAAAGVEVSTVRFYERRGLLRPAGRTGGNYRRYADDAPVTIRFVRRAQRLGFTLAEIAEVLALGTVPDGDLRALLVAQRARIDERITDLQRMRDAVDELSRRSAPDAPPDAGCPVVASLGTAP